MVLISVAGSANNETKTIFVALQDCYIEVIRIVITDATNAILNVYIKSGSVQALISPKQATANAKNLYLDNDKIALKSGNSIIVNTNKLVDFHLSGYIP